MTINLLQISAQRVRKLGIFFLLVLLGLSISYRLFITKAMNVIHKNGFLFLTCMLILRIPFNNNLHG